MVLFGHRNVSAMRYLCGSLAPLRAGWASPRRWLVLGEPWSSRGLSYWQGPLSPVFCYCRS